MNFKLFSDIALLFVESIIILLFYITLSAKSDFIKSNKVKCIIFAVFYIVFATWISIYLPFFGLHSVAIFLSSTLLLSFITNTNVYNSAVIFIITFLFIGSIDIIVSIIYVAVLGTDFNNLMNHPVYYPLFAWTSKLIQISLTFILYKHGDERFAINISKANNSQYMFAVLQLLLMTFFVVSINYNIGDMEDRFIYNIMLAALFALSLILSIFDIREREQMLIVVNKKKTLDEYVRNLEEVINVIRREKHDFMNHMQTIYAICKLGKPNALESIDNYIKRLSSDLTMSYKFFETGNDYIDGLLAIKSHTCFENDIDLSVDISARFSMAVTDESDIAGILGNILNNAIECLLPLPDDYEKKIQIITYIELDQFYLKIINNGPEIPKQMINNIFEMGITSKANSEEHGLGLFIVRQMTLKNKGMIGVTSRLDKTEFTVSFNVRGGLNADSCERAIIQNQGA
jgi:two-component system sensor histidine kinase AgrC